MSVAAMAIYTMIEVIFKIFLTDYTIMNCIIGKLPHEGFNIGSIIVVPPLLLLC
jgi:hypothetical protein